MTQPNETPDPESKDALVRDITADLTPPTAVIDPAATRKGHSNGLKVHSIVFGAITLGVLVALVVAFIVIVASDKM